MKKVIFWVLGVIGALLIGVLIINIVTDGAFIEGILSAVADPINNAWMSISGSDEPLIDTANIVADKEGAQDVISGNDVG